MDIETEPKTSYPKFLGVVLALFVPGIAHFLSGKRKQGIILLAVTLFLPILGLQIASMPVKAAIYLGLIFTAVITPLFALYILITSWRRIPHMAVRHWTFAIGSIFLLAILKGAINAALPVMSFQIPTGAMQPTLMGVHTIDELEDTSFLDRMLYGRHAETFIAAASGPVSDHKLSDRYITFHIGEVPHSIPSYAVPRPMKHQYDQGDIIWSGTTIMGDYLLADRLAYLSKEPKRGDIVIFSTDKIGHPNVKRDTVYVKRIAGLPGETISIEEGQLMVNGTPITEPEIFQTLEYGNAGELSDADQTITLGEDEFLMLGDNTEQNMSLDGRFYGPVPRESIIAKVKNVYWPLDRIRVVK